MLNNPAYRAGYVDGALESPPTPENYEEFAQFYNYQLGYTDASEALRDGTHDPALVAANFGWMGTEEARRLALTRASRRTGQGEP